MYEIHARYILTLCFSSRRLRVYVYFAIATLAIFAIPAAVLPWVLCKPLTKTFADVIPGTCINKDPSVKYARFQAGKYTDLYLNSDVN
jgi:hypothetical protein